MPTFANLIKIFNITATRLIFIEYKVTILFYLEKVDIYRLCSKKMLTLELENYIRQISFIIGMWAD